MKQQMRAVGGHGQVGQVGWVGQGGQGGGAGRDGGAGRGGRARRAVRMLGVTAAAAALTAAVSVASGTGSPVAQADPGDTFVALGTSQLVQSEDLASIQFDLDTLTVRLDGDGDFSGCLGEGNPWSDYLPGTSTPIAAAWTSSSDDRTAVYQTVGQAESAKQAKAYAKTLRHVAIRNCQGSRSPWDFHYGRIDSFAVGSGRADVALFYRGDSSKAGGAVVVIRKGTEVGLLSYTGTFGPAAQDAESLAKVAVSRLRG